MREFFGMISQKRQQKMHLSNLETYNSIVMQAFDAIERRD
jgi:hypothetical protein